jgi:uncharacterized protein YlxP (DUF503 family)
VAAIGVLTLELRIPDAHSLKEKRHHVLSLKERLRHKFNVSVAEIDYQDVWQRALLAVVTISSSRQFARQVLDAVEREAVSLAGRYLVDTSVEWLD